MRIFSIFKSISGELGLFYPGSPTIFVRFAGCPLHCTWCDTLPAIPKESGQEMSVQDVVRQIRELSGGEQIRQVLITGGEPLMQKQAFGELVTELKRHDYMVQVETSGACFPSSEVLSLVDWWVVDYKLPSSGEEKKMKISEFRKFGTRMSIKFPCRDLVDLDYMSHVVTQMRSLYPYIDIRSDRILLSPVSPLTARQLLDWQEEASEERPWMLGMRLNVQLHKLLGLVEDQGGNEL